MATQPLRFQALFNALPRLPHKTDLWRYLLLHKNGGMYLDDDAITTININATFLESVDAMYHMPTMVSGLGFVTYNGAILTRPCNTILLNVAERMVNIGFFGGGNVNLNPAAYIWEFKGSHNWYNLALLGKAIAEQIQDEHRVNTPVLCTAKLGTRTGAIPECRMKAIRNNHTLPTLRLTGHDTANTNGARHFINAVVYSDKNAWRTVLVNFARQVHGSEARRLFMRDD